MAEDLLDIGMHENVKLDTVTSVHEEFHLPMSNGSRVKGRLENVWIFGGMPTMGFGYCHARL